MKKKTLIVGALMLGIMCTCVGCGKKGETTISVDGGDTQIEVQVIDSSSDYTLSKTDDGFSINGGVETIDGFLMSSDDAEALQANSFGQASYTPLSIDGDSGFTCSSKGKYQHVFLPNGSDVYVCLSASESDVNIYAAEECVDFSVSKE